VGSLPRRIIVVGIVRNHAGEYLLCKMHPGRGVYPGQWGLPGGGVEENERIQDALRRELFEETGLPVSAIEPAAFRDDIHLKTFADGTRQEIHMIYLIFHCKADREVVKLNAEFTEHCWVPPGSLGEYDLNEATRQTFTELDLMR
jgi:nucleoside triphosphatase